MHWEKTILILQCLTFAPGSPFSPYIEKQVNAILEISILNIIE